jgi:hypothetical protein
MAPKKEFVRCSRCTIDKKIDEFRRKWHGDKKHAKWICGVCETLQGVGEAGNSAAGLSSIIMLECSIVSGRIRFNSEARNKPHKKEV